MEEKQVQILDWPAQSPDLNPLKHVRVEMGQALNNQKSKNLDELYTNLLIFLYKFPLKNVKSILAACIRDALKLSRKRFITQDIDIIVFLNKVIKLFKCI